MLMGTRATAPVRRVIRNRVVTTSTQMPTKFGAASSKRQTLTWYRVSNRNNTAFKIPGNFMKLNAGPNSNRNSIAVFCSLRPPQFSRHSSPATSHCIFNRRPARLEIIVTYTRQTPTHPINRQLSATSAHRLLPSNSASPAPRIPNRNTTPFRNRLTP